MDSSGSSGSSGKRAQDELGGPRPLKKAKFAWQVKGKQQRREASDSDDSPPPIVDAERPDAERPSSSPPSQEAVNFEDNLEMLGDYLLKQEFSCLNAVLGSVEAVRSPPPSPPSPPPPPPPQPVAPAEPSTLDDDDDDARLRRWQARQIAKGYVDNTINRVLDSWFVAPLPADLDDLDELNEQRRHDDLDDSVENKGILMAISAHGLQNNLQNNLQNDSKDAAPLQPCNCSFSRRRSSSDVGSSSSAAVTPNVPFHRRSRFREDFREDFVVSPPRSSAERQRETSERSSPEGVEAGDASSLMDVRGDKNDEESDANASGESYEHFDFIDAAVSFAIQAKGLIPF